MSTDRQIEANRKNAQRSTGPRTAEGKQRTRLNGLKHGLRSDEVVLPTEDRSEFESHLAAWMDDWKPPTETRRFLVERAATGAWRLKRCVRNENERLADRTRKAEAEWDKAYETQIERAVRVLDRQPEASIAFLSSSRVGLNALSELWNGLYTALSDPEGWCDFDHHHNRLCNLMGITGLDDSESLRRISEASYRMILRAHPEIADPLKPFDDAMADRARSMLRDLCEAKVAVENSKRFDALPEYPASRAIDAECKATEVRPEDALQHRYEGRLDREVRATITQLMRLQQTGLDLLAGEESEAPSEPNTVAPEAPSEAKPPEPEASPQPVAPSEANPVPGQGLILRADRGLEGGLGTISGVAGVVPMVGVPLLNR